MSQDEQDQIYGRLTRQTRECEQEIRLLKEKLLSLASDYASAASVIKAVVESSSSRHTVISIPDSQSVFDTLAELSEKREQFSDLHKRLMDLNGS